MHNFWIRILVERAPVALGTSLLYLVVTHPAWMPRAVLLVWAVLLLVTLAERHHMLAHQEFHRQEAEEARRASAEQVQAMTEKWRAKEAEWQAQEASMQLQAKAEMAALPRAEWMRLAVLLPPAVQQEVTMRRAELAEELRDRLDPPWPGARECPPRGAPGPRCPPETGAVQLPPVRLSPERRE